MRKGIISQIQQEDPSYDPIPAALEAAGVSPEVFAAAESRVYSDGYFGPTQQDWEEEDPDRPSLTVKEGIGILAAVAGEIGCYTAEEFSYCSEPGHPCEDPAACEGHGYEAWTVDAREIVRDRFHYFVEIYGDSPLAFSPAVPAHLAT